MRSIGKHIQSFPPINRWIFESKRPPETPRLPWKHESSRSVCFWSHPGGLIHPRWCRICSTNSSCELKKHRNKTLWFWLHWCMLDYSPYVFLCSKCVLYQKFLFLGGAGVLKALRMVQTTNLDIENQFTLVYDQIHRKKNSVQLICEYISI